MYLVIIHISPSPVRGEWKDHKRHHYTSTPDSLLCLLVSSSLGANNISSNGTSYSEWRVLSRESSGYLASSTQPTKGTGCLEESRVGPKVDWSVVVFVPGKVPNLIAVPGCWVVISCGAVRIARRTVINVNTMPSERHTNEYCRLSNQLAWTHRQ